MHITTLQLLLVLTLLCVSSWEGKLRYQMHQWRELNTELSTLLDGEPNVALVNTRATKKIEDIWSRALVLMGVEEQEKTIWEC